MYVHDLYRDININTCVHASGSSIEGVTHLLTEPEDATRIKSGFQEGHLRNPWQCFLVEEESYASDQKDDQKPLEGWPITRYLR